MATITIVCPHCGHRHEIRTGDAPVTPVIVKDGKTDVRIDKAQKK